MARHQNSIVVLLRITAFRRMWLALSTSSLGDWLGLLATTALAAYLTKNSSNLVQGAAVSGVLVTRLLPDLVLGPIAGALVDRLDRRYVAMIGDSLAGLFYLSIPLVGNLTWLLIAQFMVEAIGLFANPAKQAMWVNIVPRERLAVANQLNYVSVYGMVPVAALVFALLATASQFFGAPALPASDTSTALISVTSAVAIDVALIFDAATYFLAAGVLFATRRLIPAYVDERPPPKSVFSLVREGIGYVRNSAVMRAIYVGILGAFAAGGLVAGVAQAYVATMGAGNAGYGILFGTVFTGIALGMLIGPKVLPAVPRRMVFTLGIGVAGLALVVMSVIQDFVGAAVTSVVMGLFAGIAWITGFTMIGHEVADRLRGRVFSFVMSSVRIMLLGTIAAGPILANSIGIHSFRVGEYEVALTGPGVVLGASGLITIAVAIFAGRQVGGLRGEVFRPLARRLIGGRRRNLLDARESEPGVLLAVVGPVAADTARYTEVLVDYLTGRGWVVRAEAAPAEPAEPGDTESAALRTLAELSDLAVHRLRPAVEAGEVVVCRDYVDAAVVRFGAQARLGEEHLIRMADWSTGALRPDVTVLVDPSAAQPTDVPGGAAGSDPAPGGVGERGEVGDVDRAGDVRAAGDVSETGDVRETGAAAAGLDGVEDPSGPPAGAAAEVVDPVRSYQDLAAAAPDRYVTVAPLPDGAALPDMLTDQIDAALRRRAPLRVAPDSATEVPAHGRADGPTGRQADDPGPADADPGAAHRDGSASVAAPVPGGPEEDRAADTVIDAPRTGPEPTPATGRADRPLR